MRKDLEAITMSSGNQGSAAKAAKAAKAGVSELESMLSESPSSDRVCLKLAQILGVRRSEVALLRLEKGSLRFIFPPEVRAAGAPAIYLSAGAASGRRTAAERIGGGSADGGDSHSSSFECFHARKTCQPV